ncbi:cytochrome c oxidase assembly protein [Microbacterium flavescens]|uniref:cytochrome c oxidase assembly protein n=1 Tax=Microbacterium flavescens TaxID=69366 RepID=UPI001BDEC198|nr:cytochrome c oxidase assembly protein [Microbacterium flavescens]
MTAHSVHTSDGAGVLDALLVGIAVAAVLAYLIGVTVSRRRGRPWPWARTVLWCAGVGAGAASVIGPPAHAAHDSFVAHMTTHLLAGMVAPLLLVCAAPVTLALRALAVTPARRLSRLLTSAPARFLTHPVPALVISAGGLWLIYVTPVLGAMQESVLLHAAVHAHLLAAGFLFTAAVLRVDPHPRPASPKLTAVVLVLALAAHGILAKHLYASPPPGFDMADVHAGAQLMYYAGAWAEAVVIVMFCARWYRDAGVRLARAGVTASAPGVARG